MGCSKNGSKREVYSNTSLPQETRNSSNKKPNCTPKATTERKTDKTQSKQKEKKNHNIRAEINEIEMKKTIGKKKSMKLKSDSLKRSTKLINLSQTHQEKEKIQINKIRSEKGKL